MATNLKPLPTPGVYIQELPAFGNAVVGVQTAVPAFLGYTQTATVAGKSVLNMPVLIASLSDFEQIFGGRAPLLYDVTPTTPAQTADVSFEGHGYTVASARPRFLLYDSLLLFFANGGGSCYVVSVGIYGAGVALADLQTGLTALATTIGPTMLVAPDAVLLPSDGVSTACSSIRTSTAFTTFVKAMLQQAATLQDRVAIFDLYDAQAVTQANLATSLPACVTEFQNAVATGSGPSYGAAYFPFLLTSLNAAATLTAANLALPPGHTFTPPHMQQLLSIVAQKESVLPPSGAMAGVYTTSDQRSGVWTAPANIALIEVVSPTISLSDEQQGELNVPVNGYAIDVIRTFPGRGTIVWGARTLDGNSADLRYVPVRRTLIYIEQSIKTALQGYVFEPNTAATWVAVVSSIQNFLQQLWSQGGLMGSKASDAYTVQCGVPSTMTADDVLAGKMIVAVKVQMVHPAEYIALTFEQMMQSTA